MLKKLQKNIVLVGMMGAGKSAVGSHLAQMLGVDFVDCDAEIERAANTSISEIFARDGEEFFRQREQEVLQRLLDEGPGVIATGGGAFLRAQNRDAIAARGVSVWLDVELDLLWARVKHRNTRPLLQTEDPYGTLSALFDARVPIYQEAQIHVRAEPHLSVDQMSTKTLDALQAVPNLWEVSR